MVFRDLLLGRFSVMTWTAVLVGMVIPFALLFFQGVNPRVCSIPLTVVAALLINVGLWATRALIVVPTFYHPLLPWVVAPYIPTFSEWCIVIGSFFLFALLLLVLVKAFPVLELPEEHERPREGRAPSMPFWKMLAIGVSLTGGVALVALGIGVRASPEMLHPPAIWLSGIVLLLSVPFQICVLPERSPVRLFGRQQVGPHVVGARQATTGRYLASPSPRLVIKAPLRAISPAISTAGAGLSTHTSKEEL
jgi:hypothetical protein